ncbi:hypothetical protein BaRGS_00006207 [Batillaria attramentaria]|uniref:Uncharacterized protein n=1 Tax=Batillaria attramentaria TaxID=370345 RepID=A0ABD0LUL5_9CAEN
MLEAKIAEVNAQTREEYEAEIQRIDNKTDNLNRTLQNNTSELLELSNVTQHLNQTLQAKTDQLNGLANLTSRLNETLRNKTEELDKFANATAQLDQKWQNRTAFVKSTEDLKREHEARTAQIDAIIKAAEQMYSDLLEERIRKVKEETERNFTASLNKIATELNQTCEAKIQATKEKITIEMGEMQTETVSKISNVDSRQDFMFTLIHQLGFMRLDTWGPALAVIALLQFVLFVIVLKQGARAGDAVVAGGREGGNGKVQQVI